MDLLTLLPTSTTAAVVTSRLGRNLTCDDMWLKGMRAALRLIAQSGWKLVIGDGTAGSDFVRQLAMRLEVPSEEAPSEVVRPIDSEEPIDDVPANDRAVIQAADVLYVLLVRPGGNLHRLLQERMADRTGRVILIDLPGLQSDEIKFELCSARAELWQPTWIETRPLSGANKVPTWPTSDSALDIDRVYLVAPFPASVDWAFLTHTTRSCPGPWPDETFEDYANSLFESRIESDHSAIGALRRIVRQKKLIAAGRTVREGTPVVSFTDCPLAALPALHRFRTHRVRWDFEPYGLCIRRDWLIDRGARPVVYGDESEWQSITDQDRPFFQLARGKSGIDWTIEREWRILGDLDLGELTDQDVVLFVPDFESAKIVADVTDWPVTLWPK